jgi:hypothetical protein
VLAAHSLPALDVGLQARGFEELVHLVRLAKPLHLSVKPLLLFADCVRVKAVFALLHVVVQLHVLVLTWLQEIELVVIIIYLEDLISVLLFVGWLVDRILWLVECGAIILLR